MSIKTWLAAAVLAAGSVGVAFGDGAAIKISAKAHVFAHNRHSEGGLGCDFERISTRGAAHRCSVLRGCSAPRLDTKDSFSYKFDKARTYHYSCTIHPRMVGTIVVDSQPRALREFER